jgi:hypothetical protein
MLDALFLVSLNVVSHVFPTVLVDIFKYLSKKKARLSRDNRFS